MIIMHQSHDTNVPSGQKGVKKQSIQKVGPQN